MKYKRGRTYMLTSIYSLLSARHNVLCYKDNQGLPNLLLCPPPEVL